MKFNEMTTREREIFDRLMRYANEICENRNGYDNLDGYEKGSVDGVIDITRLIFGYPEDENEENED